MPSEKEARPRVVHKRVAIDRADLGDERSNSDKPRCRAHPNDTQRPHPHSSKIDLLPPNVVPTHRPVELQLHFQQMSGAVFARILSSNGFEETNTFFGDHKQDL